MLRQNFQELLDFPVVVNELGSPQHSSSSEENWYQCSVFQKKIQSERLLTRDVIYGELRGLMKGHTCYLLPFRNYVIVLRPATR